MTFLIKLLYILSKTPAKNFDGKIIHYSYIITNNITFKLYYIKQYYVANYELH